ncbi:MAG: nitrogenase component 1 [Dehalococcoidia bacterium]|jgi:nitrogenase molybdenum-cofactor synthesis protein NifE
MSSAAFHLPIGELDATGTNWQQRVTPSDTLRYCPPSAGGWGIIRVGLLVPESVMLFVSPAACGRHGAIVSIMLGYKKRLFFLHLKEMDIITGQYMMQIPEAVAEIMDTVQPRPKALLICATCIDDLLASDYDSLARELEDKHRIPVRICRMDPIAMDGKTPPTFTVQEAVYDFLRPSAAEKEPAINIIGNFAPIDAESEFHEVMAQAGISAVRHVAACQTLEQFQVMSRATHNILIHSDGRLAAQRMEAKLGIPFCFAPVVYGLDTIARTYQALEEFLGVELTTARYREEAEQAIESYRAKLGPLRIAVGSTANASPFELARALTEYGFRVPYIFADMILDYDAEHIAWLKQHASETEVFTNVHPTMTDFLNRGLTADLAVGFDAGYFCSWKGTVPLTLDTQPYGYRGVTHLLQQMLHVLEYPADHREQMYASGMVI